MKFSDFADINPVVTLNRHENYSFVELANIEVGNKFVKSKEERLLKGGGAKFCTGDTLFARITPSLENGKIAQVKDLKRSLGFGSTEFFVFRGKEGVSDNDFIYYLSLSEILRGPAIKSMSGASGRQRADLQVIKNIEVPDIDYTTQKEISFVLSSYDDLIENNNRRISILEEMTQKLYREWFVKFRFPGHEDIKMVDSELGEIPMGWEVVSASSAMDINPRTTLAREGDKPYIGMSYLSEDSMVIKGNEYRSGNSGTKFKNSDTLFARITPSLENGKTGYVQFLDDENPIGFGSTEFIVLRSKTLTPEFVYYLARSNSFRDNAIKSMTGATGRQRVQNSCFDNYFFAQPSEDILKQFTVIVRSMFELIDFLHRKNVNLRQQRDLLLPKLISGKIDV